MDDNVKIIMAYAIIAIGPIIGSYAVVKNSSKLTSSMFGAFNKVGSRLSKAAGKFAEKKYKRSAFGTYMSDREKTKDAWAKIKGRERISKLMNNTDATYKSGLLKGRRTLGAQAGRAATLGLDRREAQSFRAQLAGEDSAVNRAEVESFKQELGRNYSSKLTAIPHYWERMRSGDASAAEVQALQSHIESLPGGATELDKIWTGKSSDPVTRKNIGHYMAASIAGDKEAWTGAQRALLDRGSKFYGGSADVSYQLLNRGEDYVSALAHGEQDQFLGVNSDYGTTATYTKLDGTKVTGAPVIIMPRKDPVTGEEIPGDPNGGMTYIGQRAKNSLGLGSRTAYDLEQSGRLTDEAARAILQSQASTENEHVVRELAERHIARIEAQGAPINPAPTSKGGGGPTTPTTTAPGGGQYQQNGSGLYVPRNRP
jgi:hypothetical protein